MILGLRSWQLAGAVAAVIGLASPAHATVYNGMTYTQLKTVLTNAGASVTDIGANKLRITDGPMVELTQCPPEENGTCYEIQISRNFKGVHPTLAAVNTWNNKEKLATASVDDSGGLSLDYWLTTVGLTDELLADSIGWFEGLWQSDEAQDYWAPFVTPGT
jgi:hypothetical protein